MKSNWNQILGHNMILRMNTYVVKMYFLSNLMKQIKQDN